MENKFELLIKELKENRIIAFPTSTVFGFFGNINVETKNRINRLKKRDLNQKLQVFFPNIESIFSWCELSDFQKKEIVKELPGEVSLIVPLKKEKISLIKESDILVRVPREDEKDLINLLEIFGPLYATSINITGEKEINNWKEIEKKFNILSYEKNLSSSSKSSKIFSLLNDQKIQKR